MCYRTQRASTLTAIGLLLALAVAPLCAQTSLHTFNACCGFGWAVSELTDIDSDGATDLIVGANESGQAYVYSGATGTLLFTLSPGQSDLGYAVADAGDVDGDGRHDIIAGAPTLDGRGGARVYSGRTGAQLLALSGPSPGSRFGVAVGAAGDYNQDGKGDVLVGANVANAAYVISGADGTVLLTLTGQGRFGSGVTRLPDVTHDGRDEFLVSAPSQGAGKAYAYSGANGSQLFEMTSDAGGLEYGTFFIASAGDVNRDGDADIYVGDYAAGNGNGAAYVYSGRDGTRLHKFNGAAREGLGTGRGAGDVDGDGHADLAIGSYTYTGGGLSARGRVRIFSGSTGAVLASYEGSTANGNFGFDAVGVGDLNGDRRADLLVASQPRNRAEVIAGTVQSAAPVFAMGKSMAGAWYNPATSGQGLLMDARSSDRLLFVAWFTFEQAPSGSAAKVGQSGQRWLTLQGNYNGGRADLPIFNTHGGTFNTPGGVTTGAVGSAVIQLVDCNNATLDFRFDGGPVGSIPIRRLLPVLDTECVVSP